MVAPTSRETPTNYLPPHVEETVRAVEQMRAEHHTSATPIERTLEWIKTRASAPVFVLFAIAFVGLWIGANVVLRNVAWDRPPFAYLELMLSALAFFVTILILATQRRADTLAGHREQLILQLAFVSEQKTAKIIGLLEELRRDSPQLRDRIDRVADQMTEAVDPHAVSDALRDAAGESGDPRSSFPRA
jgi:uncharacterized membrane protein